MRSTGGDMRAEATEERLVRRLVVDAKAGDRDAMRELYVRFAPHVHAHAERVVSNRDDADDVTQQTFAKLLTELWRYEPSDAPFRAWMLRVSHNVAIDHLRRARSVPLDALRDDLEHLEDVPLEYRVSLRDALATLTAGQRDVLVLRHVVGLTPQEIAACLGRSLRSVHCLHHRGRAAACSALDELGFAPATLDRPAAPHPSPFTITGGKA